MIEVSRTTILSLARKLLMLLLVGCGWCLPNLSSHAHMLNMTRIEVNLAKDGTGTATVIIDLGQSLMTPSDYWLATQAPKSEQLELLQRPLSLLEQSIRYQIDGTHVEPVLTGWHIEASTLEAIHNPLTPQMAELQYEFRSTPGQTFTVALENDLEVP